jgi:sn-glycerol 3-phosphate transport system ATP-binding protein
MASVEVRSVVKRFGGIEVLHGIDATIDDRSFVVLLGPSGCGKSTLLRMIAGLEEISAGEIAIGGRVVNDVAPKQRDVAMVFQNYALYPHMKVYDNMAYGLRNRGVAKDDIERRVAEAAKLLAIDPFLKRKPRELSGGQRQRVAMGRAIVREPQVFLFDEPLSNLDAKLRVQMRGELQALHRRLGTTSLFVTHDQVEAMTLAQRMIVMNGGRAEQIGAPLEVYARPATTFVAGFIGSPPMNLIPGDGKLLGIRPEHLEPCAASAAMLTIDVDLIEPLGADIIVYGHIGDRESARVAARLPADAKAQAGKLAVRYAPQNVHWFDPTSGKRIES